MAFLGQREHTQAFSCSLWVSPPAAVSPPPFCLALHSPAAFLQGACVCRQESPAVRTHPCQVWIISARWGAGSAVSWLHCVSISFWLARLFTVPLVYSMLRNYPWSSSVAEAAQSVGRRRFQKGRYSAFSQYFKSAMFLCPFLNSWIEKNSLITSQSSPLF